MTDPLPTPYELGPDVWLYPGWASLDLCRDAIRGLLARPDRGRIANRTPDGRAVYRDAEIVDVRSSPHPSTNVVCGRLVNLINRVCADHFYREHGIPERSWAWETPWIELCHYPGGSKGCASHMDGAPGVHPVVLTVLVYLNSLRPEQGGATRFPRQKVVYQPRAGDVLAFAPGYTHTHSSDPPLASRCLVNSRVLFKALGGGA